MRERGAAALHRPPERLHKFLARAGVCSRRSAERLIAEGRIAVNGRTVTQPGTQVDPARDQITVDRRRVKISQHRSYFVFYKPRGVVTTLRDPQGRRSVADFVQRIKARVFPVGRLDYDATGALLLTDDGALAHRLLHPRFGVPRIYIAKVKGTPSQETLRRLRSGILLGDRPAKPRSVEIHREASKDGWLRLEVTEGRPHLIKRLCAAVGHPVARLHRLSYAGMGVEGLRPGEFRPLTQPEVERIQRLVD